MEYFFIEYGRWLCDSFSDKHKKISCTHICRYNKSPGHAHFERFTNGSLKQRDDNV